MDAWHTIHLEVTLDGRPVESETTCQWAAAHIFLLATVMPTRALAAELHSQFVVQPEGPTHATHLALGPVGYPPATLTGAHQPAVLGAGSDMRLYVYEHAHVVGEMFKASGRAVAIDMYDDALEQLGLAEREVVDPRPVVRPRSA